MFATKPLRNSDLIKFRLVSSFSSTDQITALMIQLGSELGSDENTMLDGSMNPR